MITLKYLCLIISITKAIDCESVLSVFVIVLGQYFRIIKIYNQNECTLMMF